MGPNTGLTKGKLDAENIRVRLKYEVLDDFDMKCNNEGYRNFTIRRFLR